MLTDADIMEATFRRPSRGRPRLCKFSDLAFWQKDNHFILTHYRPASGSYTACVQSLFYLHNESVNIHSHLLGASIFFAIGTIVFWFEDHFVTAADVLVFACFFLGAVICLGMSATYHTISNHSQEVSRWGNQLDYAGIVALIMGSFVPSLYYGFLCEPALQRRYWGMIISLAFLTLFATLNPSFRTPKLRPFRALLFALLGLSAVVPVIHALRLHSISYLHRAIGLPWLVTQGTLYVLGAGLYAARIPERWAPGKFDVWGSSHQIFHVLVLLAAGTHLWGLLVAFRASKEVGRCSVGFQ